MTIERVVTGLLKENCYILKDDCQKVCLVVDPGDDFSKIKESIGDYEVLKILLTHDHFDHVGALEEMRSEYGIDVLRRKNVQEKEYVIGPFKFSVIYTPGHSLDSVTFYFEKDHAMFVGDFLFRGTIGRTDLAGGNYAMMCNSLHLIKKYPGETILYCGHGEVSTLEEELQNNPYFLNLEKR